MEKSMEIFGLGSSANSINSPDIWGSIGRKTFIPQQLQKHGAHFDHPDGSDAHAESKQFMIDHVIYIGFQTIRTSQAGLRYLTAFGVFRRPPWKGLSCKLQAALAEAQQEHGFC